MIDATHYEVQAALSAFNYKLKGHMSAGRLEAQHTVSVCGSVPVKEQHKWKFVKN